MKKVILFAFVIGVLFVSYAIAQEPAASPAPSVAAVISPVTPTTPLGVIGFIKEHLAAIALAIYAVLDVLIYAIPSLKGNGLVQQIFIAAGKLSGQKPPENS